MVELNFSAVTVISSRPVSSEVASEANAKSAQHTETAKLASQSVLAHRGRRAETAHRSERLVRADLITPIRPRPLCCVVDTGLQGAYQIYLWESRGTRGASARIVAARDHARRVVQLLFRSQRDGSPDSDAALVGRSKSAHVARRVAPQSGVAGCARSRTARPQSL